MDTNLPSSELLLASRTDELLCSILEELKHIRKNLSPSNNIQSESIPTPNAVKRSHEGQEDIREEFISPLPANVKPEITSEAPEQLYWDWLLAETMPAYREFESLMMELDERLERCADAARFLGSSAAFVASTYDLRDTLARLFSCLNLNAVVLYPEVKRKQRFLVTRLNIQRPNRDDRVTPDRKPISGYPYEEIVEAMNSSIEELEKYEASLSSMTELVSVSLIESLRDFRPKLGAILFYSKPSPFGRYWTSRYAGECNDSLKNLLGALKMFEEKTIPAIQYLQRDESDALQNQSTVATFLSAVTATTIQFTYATSKPSKLSISVNLLWLVSLILSLGSAVTSQLAIRWKAAIYHNPDSGLSKLLSKWIARMPVAFLVASMLAFIVGVTGFALLVFPHSVIPPVVTCVSGSCTVLLVVIGVWLGSEETLHELLSLAANDLTGAVWRLYARSRSLFDRSHPRPRSSDVEKNAESVNRSDQEEIDGIIMIDDIPDGPFVVEEFSVGHFVSECDLSPDGSYVAVLRKEEDGAVFQLLSVEKPFKVVHEERKLPSNVGEFSWAPDGGSVVLLRENVVAGFIGIIEGSATEEERLVKRMFDHDGHFMSWTADGKSILSVDREDGVINVLGTDGIKVSSHRFDILMDGGRDLNGVWHTRDSERLVAVLRNKSGDDEVHVLDLLTQTSEDSITLPAPIDDFVFSRRNVLAMTSLEPWKRSLFLVHVDMEEEVAKFKMTRSPLPDLRSPRFFGKDGEYLAVVHSPLLITSREWRMIVWDVGTAKPLFSIPLPVGMNWPSTWSLRNVPGTRRLLYVWSNEGRGTQIGRLDMDDILPGDNVVAASHLTHQGEETEPDMGVVHAEDEDIKSSIHLD